MTNVPFSLRKVLMAVQKVKQLNEIQSKTANYELLEDILYTIKIGVDDQKHNFELYVKSAKAEGLNESEIWKLAKEILGSHVALRTLYRWAHEFLSEEAFDVLQSNRRLGKSVAMWQPDLKNAIERTECESCAEAYSIEKIKHGEYTYEYLQQVCIWLHETLEINCQGK